MAGLLEQFSKGLFGLAPTPAPNGVFGQVLDSAAQWGRGVQDKAANIQTTLADLLRNPSNALPNIPPQTLANLLQQPVTPEQKQNIASKALDFGMEFGPLATVWHGSPHLFNKFDMSKIGTGEGAQAYGHGLYLAESPEVAKSYSALGHIKGNVSTIGGKDINTVYSNLENTAARLPPQKAAAEYEKLGMLENLMNNQTPSEVTKFAQDNGYSKATIDWFNSQVVPKYQGSGNLYKVDLPDEHIAKMLDWDKPLSQQAPEVQAALNKIAKLPEFKSGMLGEAMQPMERNSTRGETIHHILNAYFQGDRAKVTGLLKRAGIPGIRYLDGGSRAGGKGTSNFVVFDDAIPKIIGRE